MNNERWLHVYALMCGYEASREGQIRREILKKEEKNSRNKTKTRQSGGSSPFKWIIFSSSVPAEETLLLSRG